MFGLKSLFARSKPIQYSSYVIVLALIVASKFMPDPATTSTKLPPASATVAIDPSVTYEQPRSTVITVSRVVDGDTLMAGSSRYRLAFFDAPENEQPYGQEATSFLRALIADAEITIIEHGIDKYGRRIAEARINDVGVAEIMIENGYGWPFMVSDAEHEKKLLQLQDNARAGRLGLWQDPHPISPSDYRSIQNEANNQ